MIGITDDHIPDSLPRFRHCMKRPIVVEAIEMPDDFFIDSVHGRQSGKKGDFLMRGIEGELYVCSRSVFLSSYNFVLEDREDG